MNELIALWKKPVTIARNNFKYKSLSSWACNVAVGCEHACRFCYVPSASTIRMSVGLAKYGVSDPDEQWGQYVFIRPWDEKVFMRSLAEAEAMAKKDLNKDGNRAVMFCTTTDPYQVVKKGFQQAMEDAVRKSLIAILEHSTLNVRILTRSPLARRDFDLFKKFGNRLMLGVSIPSLDDRLARVHEPKAPAPNQRLSLLRQAHDAGINTFAAVAPTYPEMDYNDFLNLFNAITTCVSGTIFHEPINIRAENVARIEAHAAAVGQSVKTDVFQSRGAWEEYALRQFLDVELAAEHTGIASRLHLWPDMSMGGKASCERLRRIYSQITGMGGAGYDDWLAHWWNRVSEWPS